MFTEELIYLGPVHKEVKQLRCRCVYSCSICRIYIPKKLQRSHFSLFYLTKWKFKQHTDFIFMHLSGMNPLTSMLLLRPICPLELQNDLQILFPISSHWFELQNKNKLSHLYDVDINKWKEHQRKTAKIVGWYTFLKFLGLPEQNFIRNQIQSNIYCIKMQSSSAQC